MIFTMWFLIAVFALITTSIKSSVSNAKIATVIKLRCSTIIT